MGVATKPDKSSEFPLLMPAGMMVPTQPTVEPSSTTSFENHELESVSIDLERIILNEFIDITANDSKYILELCPEESDDTNPEEVVRTLLKNLIQELKLSNNDEHVIKEKDAFVLNSTERIQRMLKKTTSLMDLEVSKLDTEEKTTSFLINLTNLMWIHALLSADEDIQKGLLFKNWALRHIIFNFVGYRVGGLGFVSLYDLQSSLFNFPPTFRTNTLSPLTYSTDSRVHFLIAQPYVFSPKIVVVEPDTLESQLETALNDYIQKFVILKEMSLLITVPLLLYIERVSYDQNSESEIINNSNGISDKLSWLIEVLKKNHMPYEKLLSRDMYMLNDTQFRIQFSYSVYDIGEVQNLNRTVWRCCHIHRSLYHCLMHHTSLARSTMLEDHYSEFLCRDADKTSDQVCLNNTLLKISKISYPLYRVLTFGADYSHQGQRCLYTVLSFMLGGTTYPDFMIELVQPREFSHILEIVKTVFLNIPTADICRKVQMCLKIMVNGNDIHMKWPKWSSLFFANPDEVLTDIVGRRNAALACEWVAVQSAFDPTYVFSAEAYGEFLAWLCGLDDTSFLRQAIEYMHEIPLQDVINFLIKSECSVSGLINLVSTVVGMDCLNETENIKFHALLIGLKMTNCIPKCEQMYYCSIAYNPMLIVEQLILNQKISLLKKVLEEVTPFMRSLPEILQKTHTISIDEIDELLKSYAEKALHFRKRTSSEHCKYAAMLHAFIFKDNDEFNPPAAVPCEDDWIPNNWAVVCSCCQKEFSVFTRRHHCRRCGRVVCNSCSSERVAVATYKTPQRVCDQCFKFEKQYDTTDDNSSFSSTVNGEDKVKPPVWTLNMDSKSNERIRRDASFDTAPDVELCLSLLELHSESVAVPRFLLMKSKEHLIILRRQLVSPANFNYPEVTHIARSLLLAAKVYFTYLGEVQGVRSCEELTSETGILSKFAEHQFSPPEPSKPIRDVRDWRKIKQVLLEQQNWEPALEISTKNGLECGSIWYLWGMHLLKSGDWTGAREKFSRSNLKRNNNMLTDVLEVLFASAKEKETPKRFAKLFQSSSKKPVATLPEKVVDECLYYLKAYGTSEQLFEFQVKHERIFDAIHTALTKNVSPKLFLNRVFLPYLKNNEHDKILKYMEMHDPTLSGWKDFIHEICIHCSGNKHFEALYGVQLWMKDYCRAAISSTIFYKKGAHSYAELAKNTEHLNNAISHFNAALYQFANQEKNDLVKVTDPQKVKKHLNTIHLQLEVMNIICCNVACANVKSDDVPTLFGRDSEKLELIMLVLDSSANMKSAFDLCHRLVSEYSNDFSTVYGQVAEKMMATDKENHVVELVKYVAKVVPEPDLVVDNIARVAVEAKPKKPDVFIDSIKNEELKFEMYIEVKFLKSAYVLAVKMKRMDLVEKVLFEARRLNMTSIEKICVNKLSFGMASSKGRKN